MILVDTSAWIDFFRGRGRHCNRVDELLDANQVAICGPVVTELGRGLNVGKEREQVLSLLAGCHLLSQPENLWLEAGELGAYLKKRGANVRTIDLLIAAYALAHALPVLSSDSDFTLIKRAGVGLLLAAE